MTLTQGAPICPSLCATIITPSAGTGVTGDQGGVGEWACQHIWPFRHVNTFFESYHSEPNHHPSPNLNPNVLTGSCVETCILQHHPGLQVPKFASVCPSHHIPCATELRRHLFYNMCMRKSWGNPPKANHYQVATTDIGSVLIFVAQL